jgi:hypothetical protein
VGVQALGAGGAAPALCALYGYESHESMRMRWWLKPSSLMAAAVESGARYGRLT